MAGENNGQNFKADHRFTTNIGWIAHNVRNGATRVPELILGTAFKLGTRVGPINTVCY